MSIFSSKNTIRIRNAEKRVFSILCTEKSKRPGHLELINDKDEDFRFLYRCYSCAGVIDSSYKGRPKREMCDVKIIMKAVIGWGIMFILRPAIV